MSYDLHITRKKFWTDEDGPVITPEEWLAVVENDGDLRIDDAQGEPFFAVWDGPGEYQCWISYDADEGGLYSKEPTDEFFDKMIQIAALLGSKVQGDDGETYRADGTIE
ncbi:MAG TPA: hypothetical protein VF681_12175 [Abditibacteriaceae bacterium]|jgi:hypothetical protein